MRSAIHRSQSPKFKTKIQALEMDLKSEKGILAIITNVLNEVMKDPKLNCNMCTRAKSDSIVTKLSSQSSERSLSSLLKIHYDSIVNEHLLDTSADLLKHQHNLKISIDKERKVCVFYSEKGMNLDLKETIDYGGQKWSCVSVYKNPSTVLFTQDQQWYETTLNSRKTNNISEFRQKDIEIAVFDIHNKTEKTEFAFNKNDIYYGKKSLNYVETLLSSYKGKGMENMTALSSYKGKGSKDGTEKISKQVKAAFTGMCSIDSILNLLRVCNFVTNNQSHPKCHHSQKCARCILRSALVRIDTDKSTRTFTRVPEVEHNLQLFVNEYACKICGLEFNSKHEENIHNDSGKHELVSLSLKTCFDNLIFHTGLVQQFNLKLLCSVCLKDLNPNKNGYLILRQKIDLLFQNIQEEFKLIRDEHRSKATGCADAEFRFELPNDMIIMMEPNSIKSIPETLNIGSVNFHYKAKVSFDDNSGKHFYSFIKHDNEHFKLDGRRCFKKDTFDEASKTMMLLYAKQESISTIPHKDKTLTYGKEAVAYFRKTKTEKEKEKEREKQRKHYEKNKEGERKRKVEHYENNKEEKREKVMKHYENNKEEERKRKIEHYEDNKEEERKRKIKHYEDNKEEER